MPFVGTLTHFCKPVMAGFGLFLDPNGFVESYQAVVSAGLNTFWEKAGIAHTVSNTVQIKIVFIINFYAIQTLELLEYRVNTNRIADAWEACRFTSKDFFEENDQKGNFKRYGLKSNV